MTRLPSIPPRDPDATASEEAARLRLILDTTQTAHVHEFRVTMARLSGGDVPCLECRCGLREYQVR